MKIKIKKKMIGHLVKFDWTNTNSTWKREEKKKRGMIDQHTLLW